MGFVESIAHRQRMVLLLISGILALLTAVLLTLAAHPEAAAAQISPLLPLTVATPATENRPQVISTESPSPLPRPQADVAQPPTGVQNSNAEGISDQVQSRQPLIPLGNPIQAQPSLILVSALLIGFGLLVILVLVARRRE